MTCLRRSRALAVAVVSFAAFLGATPSEAGIAYLELHSTPGSYIGQGKDYFITDLEADAYNIYPSYNTPDGDWTVINFFVFESGTVYANLSFSTHRLGHAIQAGTYEDAQRFPFEEPGHAGLDVSFWSQGSNTLVGSFTITELSFYTDADGKRQVDRFAATFDQVSEPTGTSHVYGSLNYNAFAPVPEPTSVALLGTAALAGLGLARRRRVG